MKALCTLMFVSAALAVDMKQSTINNEDIRDRFFPTWLYEDKVGIFIKWSVTNVLDYGSHQFWYKWKQDKHEAFSIYMDKWYRKEFSFPELAGKFTAVHFDPKKWAELFRSSGAKFVVLTARNSDGYALWPSKYSGIWNSVDFGPNKDVVGEVSTSVRSVGLKFGVHYVLWSEKLRSKSDTTRFLQDIVFPELRDLTIKYKVDIIMGSNDCKELSSTKSRNSTEILKWLYNKGPTRNTLIVSDEWHSESPALKWRYQYHNDNSFLEYPHWASVVEMNPNTGVFRKDSYAEVYLTVKQLISEMVFIVSNGGNVLYEVTPSSDGSIDLILQDRLVELGKWLNTSGDAIYGTMPCAYSGDKNTRYTMKHKGPIECVYALLLRWPRSNHFIMDNLAYKATDLVIRLLGSPGKLAFRLTKVGIQVTLPKLPIAAYPSYWVFVVVAEFSEVFHVRQDNLEFQEHIIDIKKLKKSKMK